MPFPNVGYTNTRANGVPHVFSRDFAITPGSARPELAEVLSDAATLAAQLQVLLNRECKEEGEDALLAAYT